MRDDHWKFVEPFHIDALFWLLIDCDHPALELCRAYLKARLAEGGR